MQSSLFNSTGETPIQQCTREVKKLYNDTDDGIIKAAIRFAGLPMYTREDCRKAFFDRVKTYITYLIYAPYFCSKHDMEVRYKDRPVKIRKLSLTFAKVEDKVNEYLTIIKLT